MMSPRTEPASEAKAQYSGWWSTGLVSLRSRGSSAVWPFSRSKMRSDFVRARLRSTISSVAARRRSSQSGGTTASTSRYPLAK